MFATEKRFIKLLNISLLITHSTADLEKGFSFGKLENSFLNTFSSLLFSRLSTGKNLGPKIIRQSNVIFTKLAWLYYSYWKNLELKHLLSISLFSHVFCSILLKEEIFQH